MSVPEPELWTIKNIIFGVGGLGTLLTIFIKNGVIRLRNGNNKEPSFTEDRHSELCEIAKADNRVERAKDMKEITKVITDGYTAMSDKMDTKLGHVYDAIDRRMQSGGGRTSRRDD